VSFAAVVFYLAAAVAPPSRSGAKHITPVKKTAAAPADEYFGPLKLSPLSVRTSIDKLGRAYQARTKSDHDILHQAADLETALRLWRHQYPRDPWLAPTAYHLAQLYAEVQTPEARKHATAMLKYVDAYFGSSRYGHDARLRLAQGFPALEAESPVQPSPAPSAVLDASATASPAPAGSGVPATPAATPTAAAQ
jgi:hypothetical protein